MPSPFYQCTIMHWISFYLEVFGWIRKLHQVFELNTFDLKFPFKDFVWFHCWSFFFVADVASQASIKASPTSSMLILLLFCQIHCLMPALSKVI